jgi:hypothetical protein
MVLVWLGWLSFLEMPWLGLFGFLGLGLRQETGWLHWEQRENPPLVYRFAAIVRIVFHDHAYWKGGVPDV